MKYLKKFFEHNVSIFNQDWKEFLPEELEVITDNGSFKLKKKDLILNNDLAQITYYQNVFGEPDYLCFDICMVKNNSGHDSNPDSLKLNIDITYGDAMVSEFTIEAPNNVNVIHYTGKGSKLDSDTFFGFSDKSLTDLVNFFNRFGYKLSNDNFLFIDKENDDYNNMNNL